MIQLNQAILHGEKVDIEERREQLELQGYSRNDLIDLLNLEYRMFSKKKAFSCVGCGSPVNMNLTILEGRPFYFKHFDEESCTYSENYNVYERNVKEFEDKIVKDKGITILKEIIKGNLKVKNVSVEDGYSFKKRLSFVPDLVITFPESDDVWVIDFFTAESRLKESNRYKVNIQQRISSYEERGFKYFLFVDSKWLTIKGDNFGTLLPSEMGVSSKGIENEKWDEFLNDNITGELFDFFKGELRFNVNGFETRNISYINIDERKLLKYYFLMVSKQNKNQTIYHLSNSVTELEEAFGLRDSNGFRLDYDTFVDNREEFIDSLKNRMIEFHKFEESRVKVQRVPKKSTPSEFVSWSEVGVLSTISDQEVDEKYKKREELASLRHINITPDGLNFAHYKNPRIKSSPEISDDKRDSMKNYLLTCKVEYEHYINGDKQIWRIELLKWIKRNQKDNRLVVQKGQLLDALRLANISFNQKDNLVWHPVNYFLKVYVKQMKDVMKKEISLLIED